MSEPSPPPAYNDATKPPYLPGGSTETNPSLPTSTQQNTQPQPHYPPVNPAYPPSNPTYPQQTGYTTSPHPQSVFRPGATVAPQPVVYTQQPQGQTTIVVTNQRPVYTGYVYRGFPMQMKCPYCQEHMTTEITYVNGGMTYLLCGLTAFVGCFCGCCLIPFCIDGCKNVEHSCSKCNKAVGTYHRM